MIFGDVSHQPPASGTQSADHIASDNPGPNAPLSDACGTSTQPLANAYASVASWTAAGMPADQITLGIPAYGYLQKSWASSLRTRDYIPPSADQIANFTATAQLQKRQSGLVTVKNGGGGDDNGQIGFADLIKQGALATDSQGKYIGAGGFYREWDACSSTVSADVIGSCEGQC
jgi:chitinase